MKLGSNDISSVKIGSTDVNKIYIGSTEVWSSFIGLLDTYSGAAAAYSLRQLKSGVTNAIQVRRASDNATQDIGFVDGQLDTTTLETFCSGTDGFVTTWYDQSGNGNDATQTTSAYQPQIVSSGNVILENGKPCVQFDGSNDNLIATFSIITQPTTHILVATFNILDENKIIIDGNYDNNTRQISLFNRSTGNTDIYAGNLVPFATNDINQNSYFVKFNGALSEASKNGNNTTGLSAGANSLRNLTIGSNLAKDAFAATNIQEIVIYPSDQSSNRSGIESNINNFYNIY